MKHKRYVINVLIWLALWQLLAVLIHNKILLAGPVQVIFAFFKNILRPDFAATLFASLMRILLGFLSGLILGMFLAGVSHFRQTVRDFLAPLISVLKAIPVVSFVVLFLIWTGPAYLALYVTFLVSFPNIYVNTLAGLDAADRDLLEMADVFNISLYNRLMFIYRRPLIDFLKPTIKVTLGMCFKSGVAAEVIGVPEPSIGNRIYMAKIYLETADLLAWTLTLIILSVLSEKVIMWLIYNVLEVRLNRLMPHPTHAKSPAFGSVTTEYRFNKSFGDRKVLSDVSLKLEEGGRYCIMEPSGSGKTTMFRIIMGLETDDERGLIRPQAGSVSAVFQEDRLIPYLTVEQNIRLGAGEAFSTSLAGELISGSTPVSSCSGGMKRLVSIERAMNHPFNILLLDEPFTGLDEESKKKAASYILKHLKGRTLIMNSHDADEAALLDWGIISPFS
ncbi:MAG: ATP-binding cassette domain-containing protein [Lachnospiraceae bacterium]|nr:ATP-binding cassette domain-containing protein [Lachnospiraceae bacterium]